MNRISAYITSFLMRLRAEYLSVMMSATSIKQTEFMLKELRADYKDEFLTVKNLIHGGVINGAIKSSSETFLTLSELSSKINYRKPTENEVRAWLSNRYNRPFTFEQYLKGMGNRFEDILADTNDTLILAAKEGWGTDKIRRVFQKNIINNNEDMGGIANYMINRVARTEILRADSIAEAESYKVSGASDLGVVKIWKTSIDGREREAHRQWNGIKANKQGIFSLEWKGNRYLTPAPRLNLPAGLCINCRCAMRYEIK